MITYIDRVCFGAAAPLMARDLGLTSVAELKGAFTAFAIAYALFEVPAGWMGDRLGPRPILIRIVLWWSACTALTGLVGLKLGTWSLGGLGTLVALRFLFGAGEAGAYPNITRALHDWFPIQQWEFAQGLIWMAGRISGGVTPLIWTVLVSGTAVSAPLMHWRTTFLVFGGLGVVWCVLFRWKFRDPPSDSRAEHRQEAAATKEADCSPLGKPKHPGHSQVAWRKLLTNPSLWFLCGTYSLLNYGWVFNITYFPAYLQQRFHLPPSDVMGAVYLGAPLWVGSLGCLSGGLCVNWIDHYVRDRRKSRRILGFFAMTLCALCWWNARSAQSLHTFCISVSLAAFCVDLTLGAAWASCQDIGKQSAAVTAAIMNTLGTLGAAAASWQTGSMVEHSIRNAARTANLSMDRLPPDLLDLATFDGFQDVFLTYILMYLAAAVCWCFVRPR
ncbi:MAG: MFS transporter [Planctomycetaceae bacterium]|nr:MFS transporter [Planctomycetaceae bacterium]